MNNLFSSVLKILNILLGIAIIIIFTAFGTFGSSFDLVTTQFLGNLGLNMLESTLSEPSMAGGVMGFLLGLVVASIVCGLISTILLIKEYLAEIRRTLKSINRKT